MSCGDLILTRKRQSLELRTDATVITQIEYPAGIITPPEIITPWMQLMLESYIELNGEMTFEHRSILLRVLSPTYQMTGYPNGYYATTFAAETDASWLFITFLNTSYLVITTIP